MSAWNLYERHHKIMNSKNIARRYAANYWSVQPLPACLLYASQRRASKYLDIRIARQVLCTTPRNYVDLETADMVTYLFAIMAKNT